MGQSLESAQLMSEDELLKAFRLRDRKNVFIPRTFRFPLSIGHYLTWSEPSGIRVYLVFKKPGWKAPLGVAFRRDQSGSVVSPPCVCDWCLHHGPSDQVGLLTATVNAKRRVGVSLCRDLICITRLENMSNLTGQRMEDLILKLHDRMARFCEEGLELSPELL